MRDKEGNSSVVKMIMKDGIAYSQDESVGATIAIDYSTIEGVENLIGDVYFGNSSKESLYGISIWKAELR